LKRSILSPCLSEIHNLAGRRYWSGWDENLHRRSAMRGAGRVASHDVEVDFSKFNPEDYLLSWFTAVAGVETEDDGFTIVTPHNKFINDNGNAWINPVLLESYHSFILAENFSEHISVLEFSKGKVLDAVAWVVEHQFNGYREPIPTVFIDCLIATNKKRHPRLAAKLLNGTINTSSMGCLIPDGKITLVDGTRRPIQEIMEGDYVLNGRGQLGQVKRVLVREVKDEAVYHGDVVGVRDGFDLTGEHPVYLSYGYRDDILKHKKSNLILSHQCSGPSLLPDYHRVDSLGVYHSDDQHTLWYYVEEVYPRDVWIPSEVITETDAELLGLLTGSDIFKHQESDELSYYSCHSSFAGVGLEHVKNYTENQRKLSRKFLLGRDVSERKLAGEVVHWPHHLQKALIRGYFKIDGDIHGKTARLRAESCSLDLIDQIYLILLRLGVLAEKGNVDNKTYTVSVSDSSNEQSFFYNGDLYRPVLAIKPYLYTGTVYNLEIEGDPSYLYNNIRIHNCDVLYTRCSRCGKITEEGVDEPCSHIQHQLGRYYDDKRGKRRRVAEECGVKGKKGSCVFKELSLVSKPAFLWAKLHGFLDYSHESTGRPLKAFVPYARYRESNKDT
jgi:hypothetical protein